LIVAKNGRGTRLDRLESSQIIRKKTGGIWLAIENWSELAREELRSLAQEGIDTSAAPDHKTIDGPEAWVKAFAKIDSDTVVDGYRYVEPSDLKDIRKRRRSAEHSYVVDLSSEDLGDRIYGAWLGRCAGCLLGKPVEGWTADRISKYMKAAGVSDLSDYLPLVETNEEEITIHRGARAWMRGSIREMARDDDIDYTILGLHLLETVGRDFRTEDVGTLWLERLPILRTYTAERAAYRNLVNGLVPPQTALFANPYREFIGAQIRADIYGYVSPGKPSQAAELAWRDARLSHTKNGIYGSMWVAATIAVAFVADDPEEALYIGMSEVPDSSRLYEAIKSCIRMYREGLSWEAALAAVQEAHGKYHWVHTINNACLVALALLYGEMDFSKTIDLAVRGGWDTDCNGATAGSVLGAMIGAKEIPSHWIEPMNDRLRSDVAGYDGSSITDLARRTADLARAMAR